MVHEDGDAVVALQGEIDLATAHILKRALDDAIEAGTTRVVVDLAQVGFLDSSGLDVILSAQQQLAAEGRFLRARAATGCVARLLDIARSRFGLIV